MKGGSKDMKHTCIIFLLALLLLPVTGRAQTISGVITDAETGDSIAYASVVYKGHNVSAISSFSGQYSIARHEGWNITHGL